MGCTEKKKVALLVKHAKHKAEQYLGIQFNHAVLSVPSLYSLYQMDAIRKAGSMAGFESTRLLSDSAAAGVAYLFDKKYKVDSDPQKWDDSESTILVYYFGSIHVDVTVIKIEEGLMEVKSQAGITGAGAEDMMLNLLAHVIKDAKLTYQLELTSNDVISLKMACNKAKVNATFIFFFPSVIIDFLRQYKF